MVQHDSIRKNTEDMFNKRNALISTIEELKASILASESAVEDLERELQAQKAEVSCEPVCLFQYTYLSCYL
jgi:outer membrane protein TolC